MSIKTISSNILKTQTSISTAENYWLIDVEEKITFNRNTNLFMLQRKGDNYLQRAHTKIYTR